MISSADNKRAHALARLILDDDTYAHSIRVARSGNVAVAMLHDVLEDLDCTREDLRALGFAESVIGAVGALTRELGVGYFAYIGTIKRHPNNVVKAVKIADLEDNLHGRRLPPKDSLRERYEKALKILAPGEWKEVDEL